MKNRQLRVFLFVLYPDNQFHLNAINKLKDMNNSLLIKHVAIEGDHKEHYHCILYFDTPTWLSSVLNQLGLSDEDAHMFQSISDPKFKRFKNVDDYIVYLTHVLEDDKPDKYDINDFLGGKVDHAAEVLKSLDKTKYEMFLDLVEFIRVYNLDHFDDTRMYTFGDWYKLCCKNGFGDLFYSNWYRMRDIIKPYLNY